jgi:hypothetical protein
MAVKGLTAMNISAQAMSRIEELSDMVGRFLVQPGNTNLIACHVCCVIRSA